MENAWAACELVMAPWCGCLPPSSCTKLVHDPVHFPGAQDGGRPECDRSAELRLAAQPTETLERGSSLCRAGGCKCVSAADRAWRRAAVWPAYAELRTKGACDVYTEYVPCSLFYILACAVMQYMLLTVTLLLHGASLVR